MKDYTLYFIDDVRTNGESYVYLSDSAPEELKELVKRIHFESFYECLPNDWIYSMTREALETLESEDIEEVNIEADVYNHELAQWFRDNCNAYANQLSAEMMEECGGDCTDAIDLIMLAQHEAITRIYQAVNDFLKGGEDA
jgi:hypothetical protein